MPQKIKIRDCTTCRFNRWRDRAGIVSEITHCSARDKTVTIASIKSCKAWSDEPDSKLVEKYGLRPTNAVSIDYPQEVGYRCPKGHSDITWSEYNYHIWCNVCLKDYHSTKECVLVKDEFNPPGLKPQPPIITGIKNWTSDGWDFNDIPPRLLKNLKRKV
ncbi:MAG: hypothetical protein MUP55_04125 [Candidatus Aenigmarchaeota archaeon]|nr:hypothetical protein [Candidatus Aenigmarchaeota archaeon]